MPGRLFRRIVKDPTVVQQLLRRNGKLFSRGTIPNKLSRTTVGVLPRLGSMKIKEMSKPGLRRRRPYFQHMSGIETIGHWSHGRWIKAKSPVNKRSRQYKPGQKLQAVHPANRLKQWYLEKGDQVKITRGLPKHMYEEGRPGVHKVYTISQTLKAENMVQLKGLTEKKMVPVKEPEGYENWSIIEQDRWSMNNQPDLSEPVNIHFTKLALLVHENKTDPENNVYATKIKVSAPTYDKKTKQWTWKRYAWKVDKRELLVDSGLRRTNRGHLIEWPKEDEKTDESDVDKSKDTDRGRAKEITYKESSIYALQHAEGLAKGIFPKHLNGDMTRNQTVSNWYLGGMAQNAPAPTVTTAEIDSLMPLYLGDELSPMSKAKAYANHVITLSRLVEARTKYSEDAVRRWKKNGRDAHLRYNMDKPEVNLAGVPIRPRTEREVKESALIEWDLLHARDVSEARSYRKRGYKYNFDTGAFDPTEKALAIEAKKARRAKKVAKKDRKLSEMKLKPGKNMVVPAYLSAPVDAGPGEEVSS